MYLENEQEREDYLKFVTQAVRVTSYASFLALLNKELKAIVPFGSAIAGLGRTTEQGTVQAYKIISIDFPVEYFNAIATPDGGFISPKMSNWIKTHKPQLYEDQPDPVQESPIEWVKILRRYGLKNLASHGIHDIHGSCSSYFTFANLPERLSERHCRILEMVVPMLHAVLAKIIHDVPDLAGISFPEIDQGVGRDSRFLQ